VQFLTLSMKLIDFDISYRMLDELSRDQTYDNSLDFLVSVGQSARHAKVVSHSTIAVIIRWGRAIVQIGM
jgi:hypothetical protein